MYVTSSIYETYARYVDLDDRTFFSNSSRISEEMLS